MPVQLSVKIRGAELKRKGLENLRREIPTIAAQRIYESLSRVLKKLRQPGKHVTYPINWDSLKQRLAFFATGGFGKGIPYHRTGRSGKSWTIARKAKGYTLRSTSPQAIYLWGDASGNRQSNIHKGRYPVLRDEVEKETRRLPKLVQEHIAMRIRKEGL